MKIHIVFLFFLLSTIGFSNDFTVKKQDLVQELGFYGELDVVNKTGVFAPSVKDSYWSLTVKSMVVDGKYVKKGEVILEIDDTDAQADLRTAKHQYEQSMQEVRLSELEMEKEEKELKIDLQRKELNLKKANTYLLEDEQNLLPRIEREKAKLEARAAQIELDQARQALSEFQKRKITSAKVRELKTKRAEVNLKEKKSNLQSMKVTAPVSGIFYRPVVKLNHSDVDKVDVGKVVQGQAKILEIVQFDSFLARIFAIQSDAISLKTGDDVEISITAHPKEKFVGKILKIHDFPMNRKERLGATGPGAQLKEIEVEISMNETRDWMRPGMSLFAKVRSILKRDVLCIPRNFIVSNGDSHHVLLKTGSGPQKREVVPGKSTLVQSEIIKGLQENDGIVQPSL